MLLRDGEFEVAANGIRHWCRAAGVGRSRIPLVAIHGGPGGNHYVFERTVLSSLAGFMTTVLYEQRGCGRSAAPQRDDEYSMSLLVSDLEVVRSALGFERIVLLGYSFGADLALEYALTHGRHVESLVLQAPGGGDNPMRMAVTQLAGFREVATGAVREKVLAIIERGGSPEVQIAQVWDAVDSCTVDAFLFQDAAIGSRNRQLWRESGFPNNQAMRRALERAGPPDVRLRERVPTLAMPSVVLVGRHDRNIGVEASAELARAMPRSELCVFERSAHFPDLEEPDAYLRAVREFLAR